MSKFVNINHAPPQFDFLDDDCIGRPCFRPVSISFIQNGGPPGCRERAVYGCPDPLPEFDTKRAEYNYTNQGWRLAKYYKPLDRS